MSPPPGALLRGSQVGNAEGAPGAHPRKGVGRSRAPAGNSNTRIKSSGAGDLQSRGTSQRWNPRSARRQEPFLQGQDNWRTFNGTSSEKD